MTGDVAQLVEHLLCKQGVVGSIPSISTILVKVIGCSAGVSLRVGCYRENRVSIHLGFVPAKVEVEADWMFAPSLIVEEQICSLSG